ncbi:MAG: glycosyltransferase, partial [Natronospirillum sp.]
MTATAHWTLLAPGTASDMSGGHQYNRRICAGLTELGQPTDLRYLPGHYPQVDLSTVTQAAAIFNALPVGSKVIVDGLAFGALPELMKTQARRLHLFALVHLPLADETGLMPVDAESLRNGEIAALSVATGVMVTSAYCARRLQAYGIAPSRVRSVPPGVDIPLAFSKAPSGPTLQLLCVANITPRKAQHVLLAALNDLQDLPWHCTLIGSLTHAPDYVAQLQQQISHCGLQDRLTLTGSLPHDQVTSYYRQTDVFVLPSVFETYGMVITEALAHGLPLVTTTGGALVDTVPEGSGLCVPPNDVSALQAALREVIAQPTTRQNLAARAVAACQHFSSWSEAARLFHHAINDLAHQIPTEPHPGNEREYFSGEWLALRQAADHQARATPLNEQLLTALKARYSPTSTTINVVDLGTGSGSNVRYLAPRLQTALPWLTQKWTLVDHDPELLNQARTACNDLDLTLIPLQAD